VGVLGFDLGSMHVDVPAMASVGVLGAILALVIWAIASAVAAPPESVDVPRDDRYPRRLDRSRRRSIGGVCAGIARYFGWSVGTTRAAFVFLAIFSGGFTVFLLYLVLWRVMPLEPMPQVKEFSLADYQVD
jgi:phage shock protein PspC (stress-responsive transcriptional regulator)